MSFYTRSAIISDLPILLQFEQGVIDAERPMDPDLRRDDMHYYDIEELIKADHIEMAVAVDDDQIISAGYARIEKSKSYHTYDRYAYLGFMYTLPAYRGQGVNRLITDHLTTWSKSHGITCLKLDVYHNNPAAIRAYEKAGFVPALLEMRKRIN